VALNMDKVLAQKQSLEERMARGGGSSSIVKWWKPQGGDNRIRVMPGWATEGVFEGQFWREVAQHWNVSEEQRGPVLCPNRTPGLAGECPICEFVDTLRGDRSNVQAQELVREIRAKTTYLLNVVSVSDDTYTAQDVAEFKKVRPDEDAPFTVGGPKVQVYACPPTVFDQILGIIKINELDITDLGKGHDVVISKHGVGLKTRYETQLVVKATSSEVSSVESLTALDSVGYLMDSVKMFELLTGGVGGSFVAALPEVTTVEGCGSDSDVSYLNDNTADAGDALLSQMQVELNS